RNDHFCRMRSCGGVRGQRNAADLADCPGGKAERGVRPEPHRFIPGMKVASNSPPLAKRLTRSPCAVALLLAQAMLQEPDGLEEIEAVRGLEQRPIHTITFSPIRGGHRRSSPSRPFTVAINFVNELTVQ